MDKYVVTINIDTKLLGKNNMISPYLTQLNPSRFSIKNYSYKYRTRVM